MSQELYYQAPNDLVFNDIKVQSIKIWSSYDDTYGYASEKINSIKDLENVGDNYMFMVSMFDSDNQAKLFDMLSTSSRRRVEEALK